MSTLSVRRPLSVLAVLAMIATMLFAIVGTASAATTPQKAALFSACPANAGIPDGGFTDVPAGSFFDDAVNCLAYYGVTQGTAPGMYEPAAEVTRAQMALFLARGAAAAGVALNASPPDAGFTDIGGLSAEAQLAINQLADAGIVKGKTATTFGPAQTVWRQQMALFLTRFLGKAIVGPGGTALTGAATSGAPFTDLGNTTVEASNAINQAWDLGVATGTSATTFDPLGNVNRGQMALFLTRLYAHTNIRPAGVNIQAAPVAGFGALSPTLSVTQRSSSFLPAPNTLVDVFEFTAGTGLAPFNANGTCKDVAATTGNPTACVIELSDLSTGINGNIAISESVANGAAMTYYAWTAPVGTTYDNDVHAAQSVTVTSATADSAYKVTNDIPTNAAAGSNGDEKIVKMGTTVNITVQLVDGAGKAVARSGQNVIFTNTVYAGVDNTGTVSSINSTTVKTDVTGKATFSVTQADPTTGNDADFDQTVGITGVWSGGTVKLEWSDNAATAKLTTVKATNAYVLASTTGSNSVAATTYDQYGSGMAGQTVAFKSDDTAGIGTTAINVVTNSSGVATLGWARTVTTSNAETITATGATSPTTVAYWVINPTGTDYATANNTALVADVANDKVVFLSATGNSDAGDWVVIPYDSGDQFNLAGSATTYALFDAALSATDVITVTYAPSGVSIWNIVTNN